MRAGAFARARLVPLLWQHRWGPVGVIERLEEDATGLRIAGRIEAGHVAALVKGGVLAGLSVGYRALAARQGARREVLRANLLEVSLVATPMQPLARIDRVG